MAGKKVLMGHNFYGNRFKKVCLHRTALLFSDSKNPASVVLSMTSDGEVEFQLTQSAKAALMWNRTSCALLCNRLIRDVAGAARHNDQSYPRATFCHCHDFVRSTVTSIIPLADGRRRTDRGA